MIGREPFTTDRARPVSFGEQFKRLARPGVQARASQEEKEPVMFKTFAMKIATWRRYRDSVRELSRLSDRELSDLGIGRADIYDVVRQSVHTQA